MITDSPLSSLVAPTGLKPHISSGALARPFQQFSASGAGLLWRDRDSLDLYLAEGSAREFAGAQEAQRWLARYAELTLPFAPRVFAYRAFDPRAALVAEWSGFSPQRYFLPRKLIRVMANGHADSIEFFGDAGTHRSSPEFPATPAQSPRSFGSNAWMAAVQHCLHRIQGGRIEKCVLAECRTAQLPKQIEISRVLEALAVQNPACTIFALAGDRPHHYFFGATPERLFTLQRQQLQLESLAGTRARGETVELDHALALELQNSAKETFEQTLVTRFLETRLHELCEHVSTAAMPTVRKLANVQHLLTTLSGELRGTKTLDDILHLLHPTPAVCGTPATTALQIIRELEPFERGLYAGTVGWISADEAEFVVAIRSALATPQHLLLYGGAGIVAGSDAEEEYAECLLKMETIKRALD